MLIGTSHDDVGNILRNPQYILSDVSDVNGVVMEAVKRA